MVYFLESKVYEDELSGISELEPENIQIDTNKANERLNTANETNPVDVREYCSDTDGKNKVKRARKGHSNREEWLVNKNKQNRESGITSFFNFIILLNILNVTVFRMVFCI